MLCTPNFCAALPPKRGRLRGAFVNVFEIEWKKQPFPCWVSEKNGVTLYSYLKSATKPLNVLIAFTRPLITEFADNLNLKHPLLPTISPYPTM